MYHKLYKKFIEPRSLEPDYQSRELVLNWLLIGFLGLVITAFAIVLLDLIFKDEDWLLPRLVIIGLLFVFTLFLYGFSRKRQRQDVAGSVLVAIFFLAAGFVLYQWGILDPYGILLFSLSITIAGILLGARYSLYIMAIAGLTLGGLQYATSRHSIIPNLAWMKQPSNAADVSSFCAIYAIIALVSWLFNRQMEMSLRRARRSEKALQRQKALLEIKVKRRTQELEIAQLEKMQELYRFAELGRLSTALFHDLANHLSTVNLDVQDLKGRGQASLAQRIQENVGHIDTVVQRVRQQIQGKSAIEVFNVIDEINEVVRILSLSSAKAGVMVTVQFPGIRKSLSYKGDVTRFRQLMLNLISNATEAYRGSRPVRTKEKPVIIKLARRRTVLTISVTDYGVGVAPADQAKIFEQFYTTKPKGVGIGLFIVQQVVEKDFMGAISLASDPRQGTVFTVTLPKSYYAR